MNYFSTNTTIQVAGQLTDWNTCKAWCKEQLIPAQYENVSLLAVSLLAFIAYYCLNIISTKKEIMIKYSLLIEFWKSFALSIAFAGELIFLIMWRLQLG